MTVTVVRPNSTDKQFSVATTAAVAPHTVLSDTNNGTIAQGTANKGGVWLGIPSVTVSATTRVLRARMRLTTANDGSDPGRFESVTYRFRDPTLSLGGINSTITRGLTSFATTEGPWNEPPPGGGLWTQAIVDRMQATVAWAVSTGGGFAKVSEVYVDWETNDQPTVTGVTVVGATTTTRPTFSWTYADADGDLQVAWQAKAFSAAQYGAAGFDPDTFPSSWDSGVIQGEAGDSTVGADLVNGTTYKVYVKAGQAWPAAQGQGTVWYSTWALSAAFTIALTPPITPTLTVSTQTQGQIYRALLNVVAPLNLLSADEAGFETSVTNWLNLVNCTVTRSTTNPLSGVAGMQMAAVGAGTMSAQLSVGALKFVTGGAQYTALASFRTAVTARSCNIKMQWFDRSAAISTVAGSNITDSAAGYTAASVTATAPANAVYVQLIVEVLSAAAAEVHRVDQVSVHRGASAVWTAGGNAGNAVLIVERRPEQVRNFRGPALNWAHPQLASGGGLTRNTDGWYSRVAGLLSSQPIDTPPFAGADGAGQARMVVWRPTTGAGSFLDLGHDTTIGYEASPTFLTPAVVGLQMRAAVWARTKTGTFPARLVAYAVDASNNVITTATGATSTLGTGWQRLAVDITPAAGSVWLRTAAENVTPTVEVDVCVSGLRICPATVDDGTTPPGQGQYFTDWQSVRAVDSLIPASPGETYNIYDHELVPGRPVLYRVRTSAVISGATIASAPSEPVAVYAPPPQLSVLSDPFQPENAIFVYRRPGDGTDPAEDVTELHPAGRDGDPVFVRDWRSGDRGTFEVHLFGDLAAYRLDQLLPSSRPLLIQWSGGGCQYVRVVSRPVVHVRGTYHTATVGYVEVGRP